MGAEGKAVREAFDGPKVEHDALISEIERMARGEHERASDSSESAAVTKVFLEKTGLNSQALSWLKSIVKKLPKKDGQGKAMDVIRSLEVGLPMIKAHVTGQGTVEMDLGEPDEGDDAQPYPEDTFEPDAETDPELDAEQAEFDAAVDAAQADDDDVIKKIDFGGVA